MAEMEARLQTLQLDRDGLAEQLHQQQIVLRMLQTSLTSKIHARDALIAQLFRAALDAGASAEVMEALQARYAKLARQTAGMNELLVKGTGTETETEAVDGAGRCDHDGLEARLRQEVEQLERALREQQQQHKAEEEEVGLLRRQVMAQQTERRRLLNLVHELRGNIRVLIRPRPPLPPLDEDKEKGPCMRLSPASGEVSLSYRRKHKHWEYDRVFGLGASQAEVYGEIAPIVESVLDGYNACVLAYGQTGAGKSHTMQGPPGGGDPGVHVRALQDLFDRIKERRAGTGGEDAVVAISCLEIYNESMKDLLAAEEGATAAGGGGARKWEIKQGPEGMYVTDLTIVPVASLDQVMGLLQQGERRRATASSKMNDHSSRSHLVLSIYVQSRHAAAGDTTRAKLHLVDLAGSERVRKSGAEGQALEEAKCINKSLSALGDVIHARLAKAAHTPYRNSQLTYLLQDSLSGASKVAFLVCVSTDPANAEESSCSLQFASRVRKVELGKAARNVVDAVAVDRAVVASPPLDESSGGGNCVSSGGSGADPHQGRSKATR